MNLDNIQSNIWIPDANGVSIIRDLSACKHTLHCTQISDYADVVLLGGSILPPDTLLTPSASGPVLMLTQSSGHQGIRASGIRIYNIRIVEA